MSFDVFMGDVASLEDVYARCGGLEELDLIVKSINGSALTIEAAWAGSGNSVDSMIIILGDRATKEFYLLQGYRRCR